MRILIGWLQTEGVWSHCRHWSIKNNYAYFELNNQSLIPVLNGGLLNPNRLHQLPPQYLPRQPPQRRQLQHRNLLPSTMPAWMGPQKRSTSTTSIMMTSMKTKSPRRAPQPPRPLQPKDRLRDQRWQIEGEPKRRDPPREYIPSFFNFVFFLACVFSIILCSLHTTWFKLTQYKLTPDLSYTNSLSEFHKLT